MKKLLLTPHLSSGRLELICFIIFLTGSSAVFGQSQLSGSLVAETDEPLVGANILLLNATDSTLVKGEITDTEGNYRLHNIRPGNYLLRLSMVGFQTQYLLLANMNPEKSVKDLGPIKLKETATLLDPGIVVGAKKPVFEPHLDRLVFNVQHSLMARGGTALDVLEKAPGITVNRQNNSISMGGKSGVIVIINGKQSRMPIAAAVQMLKGMNADNIEKVELIAQPPAKFDAEGNAGIINIVLKQSQDKGLNGSYNLSAGYGMAEKMGAGMNFNLRSSRWNLFGNYSYLHDNTQQNLSYYRKVQNSGLLTQTVGVSARDAFQDNHNGRLGIDYSLSTKSVVGVLFTAYDSKWDMNALNTATVSEDQRPYLHIISPNTEVNHWQHLMGNLNFNHTFREGQSLSINFDHLYYHDNNPSYYENEFRDGSGIPLTSGAVQVDKKTPIYINVAKIDYSQKIGENTLWDLGIKLTGSTFDNDVTVAEMNQGDWEVKPDFSGAYQLKEDIAAAYTSLKVKLSENTDFGAGLRYEYTRSNLGSELEKDIIDRQYGNFFPSAYLSRKLADDQSVQLGYSRRITRPSFNDLAPFVIFLDPFTFISGNTALQPAITNSIKGDYRLKTYLFSLQYSHDRGAIARYQPRVDPETNQAFSMSSNLDDTYTVNFTVTAPLSVTHWWEMRNNASATWQKLKNQDQDGVISLENQSFNLNSLHSFTLPRDFTLELNAIYQSPLLFGRRKLKGLSSVGFGIQKALPNGSLTLNLSDLFNNYRWEFRDHIPELGLNNGSTFKIESRILRLTYVQNFGNRKLKSSRNRNTGSEEEQGRVQ